MLLLTEVITLRVGAQTVPLPNIPANTFNITNAPYNAVGDGTTTNTAAIQSAINACTSAGGGTIAVPAGVFLSGPLTLGKSNNLQLAAGALLRMLPFGSYPSNAAAFISATSVSDVEISGSGAIDGQGGPWLTAFASNGNLVRPLMVNMTKCTRMAILGASFTNAPIMHFSIKNNTNVTVQGITIFTSFPSKNTDGIDLASVNCYVASNNISDGDDNIALGSSSSFSGNIFVTNCVFGNGHGVSIGSDTGGGVSNLNVINCSFNGTQYGLKGKSARDRGGLVQAINYFNITLTNVQFPISYNSYYTNAIPRTDPSQDPGQSITPNTPFWQNITLSNVTAYAANGFAAGSFWGLPEAPVSNVIMRLVTLNGQTGLQVYHARAVQFSSDCSINVNSGPRLFTYDAQLSTQLQISNALNRVGLVIDGNAFGGGGADGNGSAYSATALGTSLRPGGFLFTFAAAGATNLVSAVGQTLAVPTGLQATNYQALTFLGAGVNGAQSNQTFAVHYTDGSTQSFSQSMSDWGVSSQNPGEWVAAMMNRRIAANGSSLSNVTYVYEYSFPLDTTRIASGLTLPNNTNVVVLAGLVTVSPSNTAPALAAITNRTVIADTTLSFTNSASDVDQPPQLLTYRLTSAMAGAAIGSNNGVFSWRPTLAQVGSNAFTITVTDDGSPNLSASQNFSVTVTRPDPPVLQPSVFTNQAISFTVTGVSGADYYIQASTNLIEWTTIATNLARVTPFVWMDSGTNGFSERFYRALLGP